jgi:hypothetical protein
MAEEGFVRRWSRRKQEARRERPVEPEAVPAAEPVAETPLAAPPVEPGERPQGDEEPVRLEDLPDIAGLGPESDFRIFMRKGVPPELRRQALRKLWHAKPLVGQPEQLLDYADDYTDAARAVPGVKTLWRIGRGFLPDPEEAEERPEVAEAAEPAGEDEGEGPAGEDEGEGPAERG